MFWARTSLDKNFHRPDGARVDAEFAGNAFVVVEVYPPGCRINTEGADGAHGDAGAAVRAPFLLA